MRIEEDRFIVSLDMNKNDPFDIDLYCNDPWMSMHQVDPKLFINDEGFMKRVKKDIKRFENEPRYHYL